MEHCDICQRKLYFRKSINKEVCINDQCPNYYLTSPFYLKFQVENTDIKKKKPPKKRNLTEEQRENNRRYSRDYKRKYAKETKMKQELKKELELIGNPKKIYKICKKYDISDTIAKVIAIDGVKLDEELKNRNIIKGAK